jgi:3-oxoacyl-[acyl-carrier protein] reductase
MDLGLRGKRALVLAASRGLGYACAHGLAREGCDLVICSRDEARIQQAAEQIRRETGARVHALARDVSSEAVAHELVQACVEQYGGLEIAVHNAGGPPIADFMDLPTAQWVKSFEQNLMSFVWLVQAAVPHMQQAGYGRILPITSIAVKQPIPELVLSNTLRTGVVGLCRTLTKQLAPHNRAHGPQRGRCHARVGGRHSAGAARRARRASQPGGVSGFRSGQLHHRHRDPGRWRAARRAAIIIQPY